MISYNLDVTAVRMESGHEVRIPLKAIDDGDSYFLPVDADIMEGDQIEQALPTGRTRTVYVTKVKVMQSPFGGNLDHTEAGYVATAATPDTARGGSPTFNVNATNVQVSTGAHSTQTMTVGVTSESLVETVRGIAELLALSGAVDASDPELVAVRDDAVAHIDGTRPDKNALRRFADWIIARAQAGTNATVSAAFGAAVANVLHEIGNLPGVIGN